MAKLITLNFSGDFEKGFEITLRDEGTNLSQDVSSLSSNPILPEKYQTWRKNHIENLDTPRGMPIDEDYFDLETCKDSYSDLQNCFKSWLQEAGGERCRSFIREKLSSLKASEEQARIVIQTDNPKLGQLPWHEWEDYLFKNICLGRAAIAVGPKTFQSPNSLASIQPQNKVKILSIIGQSDDLNTDFDHKVLNEIVSSEQAEIQLKKPETKKELLTHINQEWHIFFFAGHSASDDEGKVGQFYLNQDSVEIEDLKYAISNALEKGLQLMIFNSCNGIGLANQLAELHLPQSIVMRENIPDEVALSFLEAFFTAFAKENKSLYSAMLEARLSLRGFEQKYPGIMSLPVIYQNSAVAALSWNDLVDDDPGFVFIDDDEITRLNEFQKDIYDTFDDLGISSLSQYQTLDKQERLAFNKEIISKMIGLGGSPDQLLELNHLNTRFPTNLVKKYSKGNQDPWNILHRKTAVYSDHSIICIAPITNPERKYAHSFQNPTQNIDERTINMLLQHRPLIELGKMSIVPEVVKIEGKNFNEKVLFNVQELETIKVDLNDPVVKSFFMKEGKMLKREGTLVFNSPNSGGLPLDQIMEIIEVANPQAYEYFQTHLKNTITSINPEDDTQGLRHALRAVDEGIQELDNKYKIAKEKYRKTTLVAAGSGALAIGLYTAGIDVISVIAAAFAGSTLSSHVSFIPGSDPIPDEIRQSPFFIPWLISHQSQSA
ncbi:CHAT domain-containing protein [Candidatus Marithrix sp. Canyon 246]|uniref:CHAT domain-containing protein n=1 Tax=Candidatus Marithrix sp. Canyon 246 TaxID=1827136 RepID=UPI00084A03E2|nr:CHAT domain-containing protein [Candidatus Marithrix sp. Canyon 246]